MGDENIPDRIFYGYSNLKRHSYHLLHCNANNVILVCFAKKQLKYTGKKQCTH
jgi:hypothetical protein